MTIQSDMALMAAGSYWDIRKFQLTGPDAFDNRAPTPPGWTELTAYDVSGSGASASWTSGTGFSARVYKNTVTGEIVISYAGTEADATVSGMVADFMDGNVPLALGKWSKQALEAAQLYQRVKAIEGGNITFTGHSLGGGLASLMAVWFDRPAYVFAPAPFQKSADVNQVSPLSDFLSQNLALPYVRYMLGADADAKLASYNPATQFAAREQNVTAWAIKGEVLENNLGLLFNWIEGSTNSLFNNSGITLSELDKHSIDLHAAALIVPNFDTMQVNCLLRLSEYLMFIYMELNLPVISKIS